MHLPADDTSQWPLLPLLSSLRLSKSFLPLTTILLHDNLPFRIPPSDFPFTFKSRIIVPSVKIKAGPHYSCASTACKSARTPSTLRENSESVRLASSTVISGIPL